MKLFERHERDALPRFDNGVRCRIEEVALDQSGDIVLRKRFAVMLQSEPVLRSLGLEGRIFAVVLYLIPTGFHKAVNVARTEGDRKDLFRVLIEHFAERRIPEFVRPPKGVALAAAARVLDDRKTVFPAEPVRSAADLNVIRFRRAVVFLAGKEAHRVYRHMVMDMILVDMCGKDYFVTLEVLLYELPPDVVSKLWRDLSGIEGLNTVEHLYSALLAPAGLGFEHLPRGGIQLAVEAADKRMLLGLHGIGNIAYQLIGTHVS